MTRQRRNETIPDQPRSHPETNRSHPLVIKPTGTDHADSIFNAIYRHFLMGAIVGMAVTHGKRR